MIIRRIIATIRVILIFMLASIFCQQVRAEGNLKEIVRLQNQAIKEDRLDDAIDYGKIALSAYRNGQSDSIIWHALDKGGDACVSMRRYFEALDFYMASVEFGGKYAHSRSKAIGLNNIGNIYETFGDYESARHYFTKSYEQAERSGDKYMMAASLLNLVNTCCLLGDIENAEKYYQEQQKYTLHTPNETLFWRYLSDTSLDLAKNNFHDAIMHSLKAKEIGLTNNFRQDIISLSLDRLGKAYYGLEMYDSVISNSKLITNTPNAIVLYPDILANTYCLLADTYEKKEMKDSVDKYRLLYLHLSDSIFDRRKFNAAKDLIYTYEDKEVQSHIFNLNDRIHTRNIWIIVASCALIIALCIATIIYFNNRRLLKANELLVSKNKELLSQANESQRLREQLVELYERLDESPATPSTSPSLDLSEQQLVILLRNITRVMHDESVITDQSFSISRLAQLVHSNTTYVSAAINQTYQKNFKTYLNEYRVRLAAQRLLENGTLTIQAIAESAGFKSASNFISAFKKVMGMNPSIYRRHGGFNTSDDTDS